MNSQFHKTVLFTFTLLMCAYGAHAYSNEVPSSNIDLDIERAKRETLVNLKYLLGTTMQKSKVLQETYSDFAPYGAALFKDGRVKYVWHIKPGESVQNPSLSLPLIRRALQAQAESEKIVGSAVIYKTIKPRQKQAQLTVELEYQTGLALAFASEMIVDTSNNLYWGNNTQTEMSPRVFVLSETDQ